MFVLIGWWGDVLKESRGGDHTEVVQISLRYGNTEAGIGGSEKGASLAVGFGEEQVCGGVEGFLDATADGVGALRIRLTL